MSTAVRRRWRRKRGKANYWLIRYTDGFVIVVNGRGSNPSVYVRRWQR
jgi:hypothetical protein